MKKNIFLLVFFMIFLMCNHVCCTIINVPFEYITIQAAINASSDSDTILVHPGTYIGETISFLGKSITVASQFLLSQDSSYIYQTILDGDSARSVVQFNNGEDSLAVLMGFYITKGNSDRGGGIFCYNSSPTIYNNIISDNYTYSLSGRGAGIYLYNSSPEIINNIIEYNHSSKKGGGICCQIGAPIITLNTIKNNFSENNGGGIHCEFMTGIISNNLIINNDSDEVGGAVASISSNLDFFSNTISNNYCLYKGGGIYLQQTTGILYDNQIINNQSGSTGGGIAIYNSTIDLINNVIDENNATDEGGGIYCEGTAGTMYNNIISNNNSLSLGGGIVCKSGSPEIINNCITNNFTHYGGGVYFTDCPSTSPPYIANNLICNNASSVGGGGICGFSSSDIGKINNNTICYNSSPNAGGGVFLNSLSCEFISNIIYNNFSYNGNQIYLQDDDSNPYFMFCDIQGGFDDIGGDGAHANYDSLYYQNNMDYNPDFIDPTTGVGTNHNALDANWNLLEESFCINTGILDTTGMNLPSVDLAGNPRVYNGIIQRVDMGAYEFQNDQSPIPIITAIEPDSLYFEAIYFNHLSAEKEFILKNLSSCAIDILGISAPFGFLIKKSNDPNYSAEIPPFSLGCTDTVTVEVVFSPSVPMVYNDSISISCENFQGNTADYFVSVKALAWDNNVLFGEIEQDTTWADTIKIIGDITINDGVTLTIDPGCYIVFEGHYMLAVQGRLLALGTETDSILFTAIDTTQFTQMNTTAGGWYGIRFDETPTTNDSSKFEYCILEYGKAVGDTYEHGGAIYIYNFSKIRITDCTISNNRCKGYGGGIYSYGEIEINRSKIIHNYAKEYGGGITFYQREPVIKNSIISYNIADDGGGGGIECYGWSSPKILNCFITNNTSSLRGGGIRLGGDNSPNISNCVISNNNSDGIYANECYYMNITNTTITNNQGYGIFFYEYNMPLNSIEGGEDHMEIFDSTKESNILNELRSANTYNSILYGNSNNEVCISDYIDFDPSFYYCDIKNNLNGITNNSQVGDYEHNIDVDPEFVLPATGTGIAYNALNADWSLQSSSICINHGIPDTTGLDIPSTDIAGNPRIYDGIYDIIDIGAFEYQGEPDPIPDIITVPLELSFGLCTVDSTSPIKYITISNIGHSPLEIDSIIAPDGFKIKREDDLEFLSVIDSFLIYSNHDTLISVVFQPTVLQTYNGNVIITSNDPDEEEVLVNVSGIGSAYPVVSGNIEEDTIWNADTIQVVGSVTVDDGITLTINPGTNVVFYGSYKMNIQGRILALGTEDDSIIFTKTSTINGWKGISFNNTPTSNDSSKFVYCKILKCYKSKMSSASGGAFYINNYSKILISNCRISNNQLYSYEWMGWGITSGGGIYLNNSSIIIDSCVISNNTCEYMEVDSYGGGIFCNNSNPIITNSVINNNEADVGGGICVYDNSDPMILNVTLYNNHDDGIYIHHSFPMIINSYINDNGGNGIIIMPTSSAIVVNTTITNNSKGIYYRSPLVSDLYNSIIWNNYNQVYLYDNECDPNFYYCDIEGGYQEFNGPGAQSYNGTYENNIDQDPLFENGYHLGYGSPCIDTGTPDTTGLFLPPWDLDGNVRIWDGNGDSIAIIDMGCYEFGAPPYYDTDEPTVPNEFSLYQNYPNPFSNTTNIVCNIPKYCANMQLKVYNIKGQLVQNLPITPLLSRSVEVTWDGKDNKGKTLSNGIYLYQLTGKNYTSKIMKMILIR